MYEPKMSYLIKTAITKNNRPSAANKGLDRAPILRVLFIIVQRYNKRVYIAIQAVQASRYSTQYSYIRR